MRQARQRHLHRQAPHRRPVSSTSTHRGRPPAPSRLATPARGSRASSQSPANSTSWTRRTVEMIGASEGPPRVTTRKDPPGDRRPSRRSLAGRWPTAPSKESGPSSRPPTSRVSAERLILYRRRRRLRRARSPSFGNLGPRGSQDPGEEVKASATRPRNPEQGHTAGGRHPRVASTSSLPTGAGGLVGSIDRTEARGGRLGRRGASWSPPAPTACSSTLIDVQHLDPAWAARLLPRPSR